MFARQDAGAGKDDAGPDAAAGAEAGLPQESWLDGSVVDSGPTRDAEVDAASAPGTAPQARLSLGLLTGRSAGRTRIFEGIPYAEPPVGPRRFALPLPARAWDGVLRAEQAGPVCPQVNADPIDSRTGAALEESEDCLTLNIYAPEAPPAEGAPVMVFIHGGGGNTGAGSSYDGQHLSEAGDVVVVTLNYRLGTLAWLVHADLDAELGTTSGNLGLRDQQLALRWVQGHIAAFGGNPDNVTLFGQSHGAACTCFHMFARGSAELVDRYILESGGCVASAVTPGTRAGLEARSAKLIDALCKDAPDPIACLRRQAAKDLATRGVHDLPIMDAQGLYVDGALIPDLPRTLLEGGHYDHAPILLGSTLHETNFLASKAFRGGQGWPLVPDTTALIVLLGLMYPNDFLAILSFYGFPSSDADANRVLVSVMDDSWGRCATRAIGFGASSHGDDVFVYSFDLPPAVHIQELDYVFGLRDASFSQLFEGAPVPLVSSLVTQMQGYWTRFARHGDPNGEGATTWPRFSAASDAHLILDREITTGQDHLERECEFWETTQVGRR